MKVAIIAAIPGILLAIVAFLGWGRERKKDTDTGRRSDLDILFSAYHQLVDDTSRQLTDRDQRLADALKRSLECEERERVLEKDMKQMRIRLDALEGALGGK